MERNRFMPIYADEGKSGSRQKAERNSPQAVREKKRYGSRKRAERNSPQTVRKRIPERKTQRKTAEIGGKSVFISEKAIYMQYICGYGNSIV